MILERLSPLRAMQAEHQDLLETALLLFVAIVMAIEIY